MAELRTATILLIYFDQNVTSPYSQDFNTKRKSVRCLRIKSENEGFTPHLNG